MNDNKDYQAAFTWLKPSEACTEQLLSIPTQQTIRRRKPRLGVWIAAAAALALLVTGVFAANAAGWLRIGSAAHVKEPTLAEKDTIAPAPALPQPAATLQFPVEKCGTYVGFALPSSYADRGNVFAASLKELVEVNGMQDEATLSPEDLTHAYASYYCEDEAGILSITVLDNDQYGYREYFTRYEPELVREETRNGMQAQWIRVTVYEQEAYCLFLHSEDLHCILVVSSNRSFEAAAQAADDLTLVDSGAPIYRAKEGVVYAMRLTGSMPAGFLPWQTPAMDRLLVGAEVGDKTLDLSTLTTQHIYSKEGVGPALACHLEQNMPDFPVWLSDAELLQSFTVNGHAARWYSDQGTLQLRVFFADENCLLTVDILDREDAAALCESAEQYAALVELVPIPIVKPAPQEFVPLAAG